MRSRHEIADSWSLWCQYVDPDQTMTEEEFDGMTEEEKLEMQEELYGPEDPDLYDPDEGEPPSDYAADKKEDLWVVWVDHSGLG